MNDTVSISKKEYQLFQKVRRAIDLDQLWFWTTEWQKKERQANKDIAEGRMSGPYENSDDLTSALDELK